MEIARKEDQGHQTVTYAAGPARDFYLAGSQRFTRVSKTIGEVTLNSYGVEEFPESMQAALSDAERALQIYDQRLGDYPYSELDVVSTPMQALGVEYPGVAAIALAVYDPEAVISGTPAQALRESVIAHEIAHQWFYNVVGNDQTNEPWLDEALVQYLVWDYYVDAYGQNAAASYRQSWFARWDRVERAKTPVGMVADAYEPKAYSAIVYGRGPMFIEALAKEMGREAFDAFLRDYYTTNMWGIATGKIFRQLAEKHCACDLTAVFEEWVYP
ncbi:MAG: M1 family aminopeptidase [Chloroflexota bacterium]